MRTRNVKSLHGRDREMSVHDRMRMNEDDEVRIRSIKFIGAINAGLTTEIMIGDGFRER